MRASIVDRRPLIMHVVHRFDVGGLENGVVNLINRMPADTYRHAVVALTDVAGGWATRLTREDVPLISLGKPPGHGYRVYPRMLRLLREHAPAVVHSRNLAALEMQPVAWFAGVRVRIQGEHGRDMSDLHGASRRHQRIRRLYAPLVGCFVALSRDLASYLSGPVGVAPTRIEQIYNGVDTAHFAPAAGGPRPIDGCPFDPARHWLVGTVGRMQPVKAQTHLAAAFVRALQLAPSLRNRLRLVLVGEGPLRDAARATLEEAAAADLAWLPGERSDVADVLRGLHCFVLPSLAEGISNTILEAMASALPVVATAVGGNAELVDEGRTGLLVPAGDVEGLARALLSLARNPEHAAEMGRAGRRRAEQRFSLQAMVAAYQALYDRQLAAAGHAVPVG